MVSHYFPKLVLTGEHEETCVRTMDAGLENTLRKGCVDSYVLKVPR